MMWYSSPVVPLLYNDGRVITYAGSGNTWTAKYTTHANDTDGNVTFTIDFDDLAGNNIGAVSTQSPAVGISHLMIQNPRSLAQPSTALTL